MNKVKRKSIPKAIVSLQLLYILVFFTASSIDNVYLTPEAGIPPLIKLF